MHSCVPRAESTDPSQLQPVLATAIQLACTIANSKQKNSPASTFSIRTACAAVRCCLTTLRQLTCPQNPGQSQTASDSLDETLHAWADRMQPHSLPYATLPYLQPLHAA